MAVSRKVLVAGAAVTVALLLAGVAWVLLAKTDAPRPPAAQACEVGDTVLEALRRTAHPDRSGDLLLVPPPGIHLVAGEIGGGPMGLDDQVSSVALVFYGPGRVSESGPLSVEATHADVAPTIAALLKGSISADGTALGEVGRISGASLSRPSPRVVVTVVWPAGGWNVLEQWPGDWPNLLQMIEGGVSYEGRVGSLATGPAVATATLATGRWPATHGVTDEVVRGRADAVVPADGAEVLAVTLAERWQRQQPDALTDAMSMATALRSWQQRGWGSDEIPDLLMVTDDEIARAVAEDGVDSEATNAAVTAVDRRLGELLDLVEAEVGAGRYVVALTADGGRHLAPDDIPSVAVPVANIAGAIENEFGPVVSAVTPTQVFLEDLPDDVTADDIGEFLAGMKLDEVIDFRLGGDLAGSYLFSAAIPTVSVGGLRCDASVG